MYRKCVAVIPALNEEATIAGVASGALRQLEKVVVVDDASEDRTGEAAAQAGAIVVRNGRRAGQGASIMRGLRLAFLDGAEHAVILDGDGAHDPLLIGELLEAHLASRADLTIGSRFLKSPDLPSSKLSANRFATGLLNRLLSLGVSDAASGMRAVSARVENLPLTRTDFAFAFDMILLCRTHDLAIHEVPMIAHYDATELHCTNQAELLCLLDFCMSVDLAAAEVQSCRRIAEHVKQWRGFAAKIGTALFFFHPIHAYSGYAIQEQDPHFETWRGQRLAGLPLLIDL